MNSQNIPSVPIDQILTPQAIALIELIAQQGSFAAAARELGKVPSSLTYAVRQLEESLDVLLFDRSTRNAQLTPTGEELLKEGQRILVDLEAVTNRIRRIATGWESTLSISIDTVFNLPTLLDLIEGFYALRIKELPQNRGNKQVGGVIEKTNSTSLYNNCPPTRIRLQAEVLSGTWEALSLGQADLIIAIKDDRLFRNFNYQVIGNVPMVYCVAPNHPLAKITTPLSNAQIGKHRVIAIADSARMNTPMTLGIQPGQDVLTVPSLSVKLHAQLRGLGGGYLPKSTAEPYVKKGELLIKSMDQPMPDFQLVYAWGNAPAGKALQWWLDQLASPVTRQALMQATLPLIA